MTKIRPFFEQTYGKLEATKWIVRWRLFFIAVAELFGFNQGEEWIVSHYLFKRVKWKSDRIKVSFLERLKLNFVGKFCVGLVYMQLRACFIAVVLYGFLALCAADLNFVVLGDWGGNGSSLWKWTAVTETYFSAKIPAVQQAVASVLGTILLFPKKPSI